MEFIDTRLFKSIVDTDSPRYRLKASPERLPGYLLSILGLKNFEPHLK
jgi:hypothetical protein